MLASYDPLSRRFCYPALDEAWMEPSKTAVRILKFFPSCFKMTSAATGRLFTYFCENLSSQKISTANPESRRSASPSSSWRCRWAGDRAASWPHRPAPPHRRCPQQAKRRHLALASPPTETSHQPPPPTRHHPRQKRRHFHHLHSYSTQRHFRLNTKHQTFDFHMC